MTDEDSSTATSEEDENLVEEPETEEAAKEEAVEDDDLRQQLEAMEKRFKDTQKAYHESREEARKLEGKLEALESAGRQTEIEEDWIDSVDDDAVRTDPATAVKEMLRKQRQEFAQVLQARDEYWKGEITKVSPSVVEFREKIAELRKDPDLADLDDRTLANMARRLRVAEKEAEAETVTPARGRIAGKRSTKSSTRESDADKIRKSPLYQKIYGGEA